MHLRNLFFYSDLTLRHKACLYRSEGLSCYTTRTPQPWCTAYQPSHFAAFYYSNISQRIRCLFLSLLPYTGTMDHLAFPFMRTYPVFGWFLTAAITLVYLYFTRNKSAIIHDSVRHLQPVTWRS